MGGTTSNAMFMDRIEYVTLKWCIYCYRLLYTEMDTYRFRRPQDNVEQTKRPRRRYLPTEQPNTTYEFTYKCYQCGQPYNL